MHEHHERPPQDDREFYREYSTPNGQVSISLKTLISTISVLIGIMLSVGGGMWKIYSTAEEEHSDFRSDINVLKAEMRQRDQELESIEESLSDISEKIDENGRRSRRVETLLEILRREVNGGSRPHN